MAKENDTTGNALFDAMLSQVGESCMLRLALEPPALVDEMDDAVAADYAAMPERLYRIGSERTERSPTRAAWNRCSSGPLNGKNRSLRI